MRTWEPSACNKRTKRKHVICSTPASERNGPCPGDAGAPVLHRGHLVGIHSSGPCGIAGPPKIAVRIGDYLPAMSNFNQNAFFT